MFITRFEHRVIIQKCPGDLWFNAELLLCGWPEESGCPYQDIPTTTVSTTTDGLGNSCDLHDPPPASIPPEAVGRCNPCEDFHNPSHLPHRNSCDLFFKCNSGYPMLMECLEGQIWSIELDRCEFPENAICIRPIVD